MTDSGDLNRRLSFQRRSVVSDEYGNEESTFVDQFERWSRVAPSVGIETVTAARLTGQQPVDIMVRYDPQTKAVEADWRAVDLVEGTIYALKSPPAEIEYHAWLVIKAIAGVEA